MSEKEHGSQIPNNESLQDAECSAVHSECQEAREGLDREICLQNLVDELGVECTPQEKALLVTALIEKEKSLPRLLTELPQPVVILQIDKILSTIKPKASEQALKNEQTLLQADFEDLASEDKDIAELTQGTERKRQSVSELTQEQKLKLDRKEQDKTMLVVLSKDILELDSLADQQAALKAKGLRGHALLDEMQKLPLVQENTELQKSLEQFRKIISLAQSEEDKAILESKITNVDFASVPSPQLFIQEQIFDAPDLSQATKDAIAKEFKITPYKVVTGSDVKQSFNAMTVNPQTGEQQPRFTKDDPLDYRPGVSAFNGESGERYIQFKVDPPVKFDVSGWSPDAITDLSEYGALFVGFQEAGVSNFMVHNFHLPNALDPQFDPLDAVKSRQIVDSLLGFGQGYDGKIYASSQGEYFQWFVQMLSPRGDWAQGDFDVNASNKALEDLGVRDEGGNLNLDVLESVGSYARGIYGSGVPDYHALQQHLHDLYGDQVPLTGDNAVKTDTL